MSIDSSNTPISSPASKSPDASEAALVRQGERTVDNLKRLYAFVFAISFGAAGLSIIDRLKPLLLGEEALTPGLLPKLINFEMVAIFGLTASVFFHQGAKFLDNRYAMSPLAKPHPAGFAFDYLSLVATMVPFFFMAQALHPSITEKVGYIWFFWFYVALLAFGLILLALGDFRHWQLFRRFFPEDLPEEEIRRESNLRLYWLVMNGLILLGIMMAFEATIVYGFDCPLSASTTTPFFWFLLWFGVLALARDILDYSYAWNFTFPGAKRPDPGYGKLKRFIGYPVIVIAFGLIACAAPWNVGHWAAVCKLGMH